MKKTLLIVFTVLCVFVARAQKHIATANHLKTIPSFSLTHSLTQRAGPSCDTLKIDSAANLWSGFFYSYGTEGYVFGVSNLNTTSDSLEVLEDANYYDVSGTDYTYVSGGLVYFAYANSNKPADLDKNIIFNVYDDLNGVPNNLLGSATAKLSSVKNDVTVDSTLTEFIFDTPIAIPANKIFYVSVDHSNFTWGNGTQDSIAILANANDEAPAAAYQFLTIKGEGSGWTPVNEFWSADGNGTPLDVNLFIFPYMNNSADGCTALPVSLLSFKGSVNDKNQAYLSWSTANEVNNKGFSIERSNDGRNFNNIGFVAAAHNTKPVNNYNYTDVSSTDLSATNYYRLKQIDNDGKSTYSKIVPLSLKNIVELKIYPNPIKDKITVELNLAKDAKVNVQLISKDGKVILNADKGTLKQGAQQLSFNINNLASGSYFVRIKAGDKYYTQTIIKQ